MSLSTIVPALRLEAVSGNTLYPSEGGFSAVWGEVESDDAVLTQTLDRALEDGESVTLRCGKLEVSGKLDRCEPKEGGFKYRIHIQSVQFGSGPSRALVA
jgi:hypothetical protein